MYYVRRTKGEEAKMKIIIGGIGLEANTFTALKTGVERIEDMIPHSGQDMIEQFREKKNYISGMISKAEQLGAELIPTFFSSYAGGTMTFACYSALMDKLLSGIKLHYGSADGICLALHGAGVAEGIADMEGDILEKIRAIVGDDMPVTASFDLHGNISARMVSMLNGVVACRQYPHTDCFQAGEKALEILVGKIRGAETAVALRPIPILISPPVGYSLHPPVKDINIFLDHLTREKNLLSASFFHGFHCADTPYTRASAVVTAYGDQALAEKAADKIAEKVWSMREQFRPGFLSPEDAMDKAQEIAKSADKPVIINESSDNPGGGTPGDGTHLLREMLARNLPGTCFGFIRDAEFVEMAEQAGVGNTVSGLLGGKTDPIHGQPIAIENAYVKCITNGKFILTAPMPEFGTELSIGKTVRMRVGNVDVVVASLRMQTLDDMPFRLHGMDVREYKIVALKSSVHFRAFFKGLASEIVTADPPGVLSSDFSLLTYHNLHRPIFPLDENASL